MGKHSKTVDALVKQIDRDRLVLSLQGMIAVPSVNPFDDPATAECSEEKFAAFFADRLAELGICPIRTDVTALRPNVHGRLGSDAGPNLLFAGHLDTVGVEGYADPFNPLVRDDRVYGRGACDMKAAFAAYLEVARILIENGVSLNGQMTILGVSDEEHQMIGSKWIKEHGPIPDFAVVGEPTELKIHHAHKGQLYLNIETQGRACHSSVPENGINAISHMARIVAVLDEYGAALKARTPHPVCGHGTVNPGVIGGGTISSSVPDRCRLEIDRRLLPGESWEDVVAELRRAIRPLENSLNGFSYSISAPTLFNLPLDTDERSTIVGTVAEAFAETLGTPAQVGAFGACTDAPNYLCPAVVCGPGSIDQAHTLDEFVAIKQLEQATEIYLRTALKLLT